MDFDILPTEIVTQVFLSLPNVSSVLSLASTCHRFQSIYRSSKKLIILYEAARAEFGPVEDAIQIITHNSSQLAHVRRTAPVSDALIHQIVKIGRVAQRWEETYQFKKWKTDFAHRRLLSSDERYLLRRALYRLWLFTAAFHNASHVRHCRGLPEIVRERGMLLHNFSNEELAEMLDVHLVMRDVVCKNVCPSNSRIQHHFQKRFPEANHQILFNIHLNYPPATSTFVPDAGFHNSTFGSSRYRSHLQPSRWHEPAAEGWGDDIDHYYVTEDVMKLNPEQILYLRDQCPLKRQVEAYIKEMGEWFDNNGETFSETCCMVIRQRGGSMEEFRAAVDYEEMGVVVRDDD